MTALPPESKAARNERRKAVAATLNAVGVAALIAGPIQPLFGQASSGETIIMGIAIFTGAQLALHAVLRSLED